MTHRQRWLIPILAVSALMAALTLISLGEQRSLAVDGIIYVDADATGGDNNGTSWDNAFTDLQDALEAAGTGTQIWVSEGTYTPTQEFAEGDPRSATFQLKNGVAIYGGFAGGETEIGQRDWVVHRTILSGDLLGDDGPDFENNDENSYHVFYHPESATLDASAILDGITITGGYADGADPHDRGGGMHNDGSSPALANCTFAGNFAAFFGGGLYNLGSSPPLTKCTFSGNSSGFDGGGMLNIGGSLPLLTDCMFQDNSAAYEGGGMFSSGSSPSLTNCTFQGNSAVSEGGGMYNGFFSSPLLINCAFSGNSSASGGGMLNAWSSSPSLTNCTFTGNSAVYNGGGISNWWNSSPTLVNCILWENSPNELYKDEDSQPTATYSDIQGSYEGEGNIDADPLFADAGAGDFHLSPDSPCIDVGTSEAPYLPIFDFDYEPRRLDGDHDGTPIVDMGVDEFTTGWPHSRVYLPLVLKGN